MEKNGSIVICIRYLFLSSSFFQMSEKLTRLCQTAGNRLVTAIADMGNAQQERNAIAKFLDDSDIKNVLRDARQSMEALEQRARCLNEDRFVMYVCGDERLTTNRTNRYFKSHRLSRCRTRSVWFLVNGCFTVQCPLVGHWTAYHSESRGVKIIEWF